MMILFADQTPSAEVQASEEALTSTVSMLADAQMGRTLIRFVGLLAVSVYLAN